MGWNAEIERSRQSLMRLAAMLFALAALADRASFAPRTVRRAMLKALRPGALYARTHVFGLAQQSGAIPNPSAAWVFSTDCPADFSGDSPDDAIWLAYCFRVLAWSVQFLLALAQRCDAVGQETSEPDAPAPHRRCAGLIRRAATANLARSPPDAQPRHYRSA